MGLVLDDGLIRTLNNSSPADQIAQTGTQLDNALGGVLPIGSISTGEIADQAVTAAKIANATITTTQISGTAGITGAQLAAGANIAGTQLAAAANIAATQITTNSLTQTQTVEMLVTRTATLTATAAGTPVTLLLDADVPAGKKAYLVDFKSTINGATAWSGGTFATLTVQDTNGTPVVFATVAVAAMTANAFIADETANVTLGTPYKLGTGGTVAKGLVVVGNANAGAGSDFVITATIAIKA